MNLTFRKLQMLEREFIVKEEAAKIDGFYTSPVDKDLQSRVTNLLDQVRSTTIL